MYVHACVYVWEYVGILSTYFCRYARAYFCRYICSSNVYDLDLYISNKVVRSNKRSCWYLRWDLLAED